MVGNEKTTRTEVGDRASVHLRSGTCSGSRYAGGTEAGFPASQPTESDDHEILSELRMCGLRPDGVYAIDPMRILPVGSEAPTDEERSRGGDPIVRKKRPRMGPQEKDAIVDVRVPTQTRGQRRTPMRHSA